MRTFALAVILITLGLLPAYAQEGPKTPITFSTINWCAKPYIDDNGAATKSWAAAQFETQSFSNISEVHKQYISETCNDLSGRPQLGHFWRGLADYFKTSKAWDKNQERISAYRKAMPKDPQAPILEATYWIAYAWDARGSGYASSVSADGWKHFRERLEKAKKVLEDSKSYASTNPEWYMEMLIVQAALDAPQRVRDATFVEGVGKYPWYLPLYFTRAEYLAPWWGGDWDSIENLSLWSVKQTKAKMGNTMYARIYWAISHAESVKNLFKDTKASWPTMKSGFDDMMRQFPESNRNLNAYARFACDAGDKETYLKLRKKLAGKALDDSLWGTKHHEVCDVKFGYKI
ncbi:MAG: DUF4034 domain-containing protein [Rhodocyclales bacterium]|nr:DUF4034 domain-containing protein [Rhodocyclales bacterium]